MFLNSKFFLNNLIYLWPVYALILAFIFIAAKFLFEWLRTAVEEINRRKEKELQELVAANSEWYQSVIDLNNQTKFYEDVVDNGRSVYYVDVASKAKFDRTEAKEGLYEFLVMHRSKVERAMEQVYRNQVIYEVYCKKFDALHSSASVEKSVETGINFDKFMDLEKKAVREAKLKVVKNYTITCHVKYVSPQGRNRYSKHRVFDEMSIRSALKELDRQNAYQASEEWRKKHERAKVTSSLRYDVIQRDGGRCRLCGRSAADGVTLEVDHIVPISKGGKTAYANLQTLCKDCNRGKSAKM